MADRILCVGAHPDDLEFGAAGSVAKWTQQGAEATYLIVTDGSTGTADHTQAGDILKAIRRDETHRAAEIVGVPAERVLFLDYRDGYVEQTLELRRDIARVFRLVRPQRLVTMDPAALPGGWFVNHPDHRAVGHATLDVTITAGTTPGHFPELLDEGLEPWRGLEETYIYGPGGGETAEDISATIDLKIQALRSHASQVGDWDVATMVRGWTSANGRPHGFRHAELFHVLRPRLREPAAE